MLSTLLAGVDIGGTKIAAGLCDATGRVIASRRVETAREGDDRVIAQIIALLRDVIGAADASGATAIGISVPAVIDQARGAVLWAPNIVGWQSEVLLAGPIAEAIGAPVSLHYDGHAWVMGEWWCGAARGANTVALIAVGTGIGGGLIIDGRLHRGRTGVAGAVGWWLLDPAEVSSSRRGPDGWLESIASGPAIARAAGQPSAEQALRAARDGNSLALSAVSHAAEVLGIAAANIASALDPDVIVFAGGVIAGGADLLLPRIREIVACEAQPQVARGLRLTPAELGEDAAWLGAARLSQNPIGEETA
jgi:glucokinase